ncbi:MAG: DUF4266 domain-containing protein [Bacteroidota bacterium]|jgi:hypothetical protein|nr:DUF4266 domain-containing protein [Bacteroidota bacterium]
MIKRFLPFVMIIAVCCSGFFSCSPVKAYQKNRLNDAEMSLSSRRVQKNELNFQTYREGSAGANGGKTGGGCGCN